MGRIASTDRKVLRAEVSTGLTLMFAKGFGTLVELAVFPAMLRRRTSCWAFLTLFFHFRRLSAGNLASDMPFSPSLKCVRISLVTCGVSVHDAFQLQNLGIFNQL